LVFYYSKLLIDCKIR